MVLIKKGFPRKKHIVIKGLIYSTNFNRLIRETKTAMKFMLQVGDRVDFEVPYRLGLWFYITLAWNPSAALENDFTGKLNFR